MPNNWVRYQLIAELLTDAHPGSGSGGEGIDALVSRDRHGRPVIWASHVEGVLRDAARRLRGNNIAQQFFGCAGGERQRAMFTSLYTDDNPDHRVWRSTARAAFDNRAPKEDTLRAIECVPKGTPFVGQVELPEDQLQLLQRLVKEVDALGSGRAAGSGRVKLSLECKTSFPNKVAAQIGERLLLLLKNLDPLCITATATPTKLIPSFSFIPGRALLGAIADWLTTEGHQDVASLLTGISVSDALPLPEEPAQIGAVEVLPAPLTLQSKKPAGSASETPWWALPVAPPERLDAWNADSQEKLKRPEDNLFVYRASPNSNWIAFRPALRVRLRNGRPDPSQPEPSLFAIEQIVEGTYFLAELRGDVQNMEKLVNALATVLSGARWLRVGRGGAPVEVIRTAFAEVPSANPLSSANQKALLILTSDLLLRDDYLRWRSALDEPTLSALAGDTVHVARALQDSAPVRGFNGTSRLWRMPAVAIRRGSVYEISGPGVALLQQRAAQGRWLGERTHEGFGRFRLDAALPGVTQQAPASQAAQPQKDDPEEAIAAKTKEWFDTHKALAQPGSAADRKPSLSQWFDLVSDLERNSNSEAALKDRLNPTTAGAKSWKHKDAEAILRKLQQVTPGQRAVYARYFVRWLRAELRASRDQESSQEKAK